MNAHEIDASIHAYTCVVRPPDEYRQPKARRIAQDAELVRELHPCIMWAMARMRVRPQAQSHAYAIAWAAALAALPQYDPTLASRVTYVRMVALRAIKDYYIYSDRRSRTMVYVEDARDLGADVEPVDQAAYLQQLLEAIELIASTPDGRLWARKRLNGETTQAISDDLGISMDAVSSRIYHANTKIKQVLRSTA